MLLPGSDLHWVGPLAFRDFFNIFLLNAGEDQKNVLSERGTHGTLSHMLNPSLVIALRS